MLKALRIGNFAIIDELELDFGRGMSALTGETGAGKSILLDALGLVLGDRADMGSLREGAARAEISATFDIAGHEQANEWLAEQALDSGEECILRRVISRDGPSKAFINGSPATLQSMRTLAEMLVTIHGQHEHQSLLKRDVQRRRLDDYGDAQARAARVAEAYEHWRDVHERFTRLQTAEHDRAERLGYLRFQAREFEQLALGENEWIELEAEHQRLAHASRLLEAASGALDALYDNDDEAAYSVLSRHHQRLETAGAFDGRLAGIAETLNGALVQVAETADQLRGYLSDLNLDPDRLAWVEERMGAIHDLARKHRTEPENLPETAAEVIRELEDLEHADERLAELERECLKRRDAYLEAAAALSAHRRHVGERLSEAVSAAMETLGMAGGRFEAAVAERQHDAETGEGFSPAGLDRVEFQVTANPGQSLRPLAKVASGGELSRISLAIQMITAANEPIPTLIFDEVDAGVGGGVAEIVGAQLRSLGEQRQVLCVTHLPQVASQAHHHFRVSKLTAPGDENHTRTQVSALDDDQRIHEIARMLGGVEITEATRTHAQEMIGRAARPLPSSA